MIVSADETVSTRIESSNAVDEEESRLSLRRLVRKLEMAINRAIRSFTAEKRSRLDYSSLISLSNASRQEAMRTMSNLSSRIAVDARQRQRGSRTTLASSQPSARTRRNSRPEKSSQTESCASRVRHGRDGLHRQSRSLLTTSSDSTKLGEVSRRHRNSKYGARAAFPHGSPCSCKAKKRNKSWWNPFRSHGD